ncbi:MAG: aminotransferase class I/II-fold pyridoxal phosphate-dependent enzyme [Caldilineales bacterium]|nr:aminotransferase class I/II-fold pyridoxal phosphate-dependent enzyme [Caldilineales bacterium]
MAEERSPFRFLAASARGLEPSATLAINELINDLWDQGREVFHLGFGESRFPVHPKIAEALRAQVHQQSYLPAQGLRHVREAIAAFYQDRFRVPAHPDRIIVGPGSKPLIYALMLALDGDLLLTTPSWVSYQPHALLAHKASHRVPGVPENNYELAPAQLSDTITRVRMNGGDPGILMLNSPSNPTGRVLDAQTLEAVGAICRQENIGILSDEIYGLINHGSVPHASASQFYPEGTVVLGGISKHLSLGGWRFGVAVLPNTEAGGRLLKELRVLGGEIWSATTAPVQYAAQLAYSDDPEINAYIDECAAIHAIRTHYLWTHIIAMGIRCPRPEGGFYLFPDFEWWREPLQKLGVTTSAQLSLFLLEKFQIATLPGSAFGSPPTQLSLRLSSSYLDMESREKAQAILDAYRVDPDPKAFMSDHHPATNRASQQLGRVIEYFEMQSN